MQTSHVSLSGLLEHLAGRGRPGVPRHLESCAECRALAAAAVRVRDAGRRAATAPQPSRRALRRAQRIFRDHHSPSRSSVLRLVLDTLLRPAPALRTTRAAPTRFLRYEGEVTVEIQLGAGSRGVDLLGQLTPATHAREVEAIWDAGRRRARIDDEGVFRLRNLPRREIELRIGTTRITGLRLS